MMPFGSNSARKRSRCGVAHRALDLEQGVDRDRPSVRDDEGIHVDRAQARLLLGDPAQADDDVDELLAIDRRLATERPEPLAMPELVEHLVRVDARHRDQAEDHVAQDLGEDATDAEHHAAAERRIGRAPGDELALARRPCVRPAGRRARPRGAPPRAARSPRGRPPSASRSPRRTSPRSVLWAIALPHSLTTTGKPSSRAAAVAAFASPHSLSSATGIPAAARRCLDSNSDSVLVVPGTTEAVLSGARSCDRRRSRRDG